MEAVNIRQYLFFRVCNFTDKLIDRFHSFFQWEKTLEVFGNAESNDYEIQLYEKTIKFKKYENKKNCVVAKEKWEGWKHKIEFKGKEKWEGWKHKIEFKGKHCDDDKYSMCKTGSQGILANTLLFQLVFLHALFMK